MNEKAPKAQNPVPLPLRVVIDISTAIGIAVVIKLAWWLVAHHG